MPTIAYLPCSITASRLGLASRLTDELRGKPALQHTVERLQQCQHLDQIVLACEPADAPALRAVVDSFADSDATPVVCFALPDGVLD